jgi:hypothetical protein
MSNMYPVSLGKVEVITERPFTHTDHISKDGKILEHMTRRLRNVLEEHPDLFGMSKSVYIDEPDGLSHRYFIPRPDVLSQEETVYLVGFFSHKQERASKNHFGNLDKSLIEQLPTYQGILSYSTMALPGGDFGNLVLLRDEEIKTKWMQGEIHSRAVKLSPSYYQFVRINNGVLPDGIKKPDSLRIMRVKYYDYAENPPWKAVRELT